MNYADPSGYKRSSGSSGGSSTTYSYSGGMHTVTTTSGWTSSSVSMSTPVWEHVTSNMSAATGYGASSTEVYGYIAGGTSYGEAAASAAAYRAAEAAARAQAAQREQARVKQATDLRRTPQAIAAARGLQELTHQKKAAQAAVQRAASALKLPALTAQQMREMLVNTGKIGGAVSAASKPTAISDLKTAASSNNNTAIFNTSALGGGTGYSTTGFDRKYVIPALGAIVTAVGIYSGGASLLSLLSTLPQGGAALAFAGGGELALSVEGVLQAAIKTAATITATVSATKVEKVLYDSGKGVSDSSSLRKIKNNKEANKVAQKMGYEDAEVLKEEFVSRTGSKFNMMIDTKTGEIVLESISNSRIHVFTGLFK